METVIKVLGLTKSYGNKPILSGLNFNICAGEVYGLLGANGAGKSTTIESILGIKQADQGAISILGMDPTRDRTLLFQQVGVQFQQACYPEKIKVHELCQETACLYANPLSYELLLHQFSLKDKHNEYVNALSGGQRQKLFVVLALIPRPKIVFLDELTTGLDPKSRRVVWRTLLQLKQQGMTIFLTSHFMDEVEVLCDRIGILKNGNLVFEGSAQEAIAHSQHRDLEEAYLWFIDEEETDNG